MILRHYSYIRTHLKGKQMEMMEIDKDCSCGKHYDAKTWVALSYVGVQDPKDYPMELRNCSCGSTLGVDLFSEVSKEIR